MKNLKKVLALVLAFAMAFTMMATAGAAYTDQADIEATEAVDVLNALGVMTGDPNGSFRPNDTITRAEACRMIYTIRSGGNDDASSYAGMQTTFTDVPSDAWYAGYVKHCQSVGIVSGKSATIFDPNANVTGVELALMCLRVMGYDPAKADIGGSTWSIKTIGYATEAGLLDDVNTAIEADCPRQWAAQLMYNMIDANTVRWSNDSESYTDRTQGDLFLETVGYKYMGLREWIGDFTGNSQSLTTLKDGQIQVNGSLDGEHKTTGKGNANANFKYDLDLLTYIGEEVSVLFKDGKGGTDGRPDDNDTIYGVYVTGDSTTYTITKGDLQEASASDLAAGKIKFGDNTYEVAAQSAGTNDVIVKNYGGETAVTAATTGTTASAIATYINNTANGLRVNSNDAIKFVCNDNNKIAKVYVVNSKFGKVASVTSDKIAIEGLGTVDLEDCSVYEGVAAGDLVQYVQAYPTGSRLNVIEKAATVTGTISSFKSDDSQVLVDGNWYKYDDANDTVATDYTAAALANTDVGDEVELIVDGGYYVAYNKISNFNEYALVTKGTEEFGDQRVKLLKADGSETTAVVDDLNDGAALPDATTAAAGKLYAYDLKSENTKVDLSAKDYTSVTATSVTFNGDNNTLSYTASGAKSAIVASDAAVFVYVAGTENKWKVYTAKDLGSFSAIDSQKVQFITDDNKIVALAVVAAGFPTGGSDSTSYGYVIERVDTKIGDDNVVALTVWDGTNEVIVNVDGRNCDAYVGDFVQFPIVGENVKVNKSDIKVETSSGTTSDLFQVVKIKEYDSANKRLITTTEMVGADNKVVSGTDTAWSVASDVKVIGVNTEDKKASSMNSILPYTKAYKEDYQNAVIVYDQKTGYNEIKVVFIDEDNKLTSYSSGGSTGSASGIAGPEVTVTDYTTPITSASGTMSGVTISAKSDKAKAVQGETVTVTVTLGGNATKGTEVAITGVTPTDLTVSGTGLTKVDNKTFRVAKDTTSGTVTFTYAMGASYTAPVFTGTAALEITQASAATVDGTAADSATFSTTSVAEAFDGDKVSVTLTLSKTLANDTTIAAGSSGVTVPADTKIVAGQNSVTFEVTMGSSAADLSNLTVECNS